MGSIVGSAVVSHVPPLVMPEADRREMNNGEDTTLYQGLKDLRTEKLDSAAPDTIVVLDSHWFTTVEHVITAHDHREGLYTSEELPRGMSQMPYSFPGDPELAHALAATATDRDDTWITAVDDPYLPIHYPTTNLLPFLQGDERWVSVSICQTARTDDFLLLGELLGAAIDGLDRRVVILASGGLSHRFWPLREFRLHEAASLDHVRTPEARAADEQVLAWMADGDHGSIIDNMDDYLPHAPEGRFGHYLIMAAASGGRDWTAKGTQFGRYEAVSGTGQAHIWFDGT